MSRFTLGSLSLLFAPQLAFATSPPAECVGEAPVGFEAAYPYSPVGYLSWALVLFAFALSWRSHRVTRAAAEERGEALSSRWLYLITGAGVSLTIAGLCLSLLLLISASLRNDCFFCETGRPAVSLLNELLVVAPVILVVSALSWGLERLSALMVRHCLHLSLIVLTWGLWLISLSSVNALYLSAYCQ